MNLLPFAFVLLLAGNPADAKPAPLSLHGIVVMAETNTPVGSAVVNLRVSFDALAISSVRPRTVLVNLSTKTDQNGVFAFSKVPPGDYRIDVRREPGYRQIS